MSVANLDEIADPQRNHFRLDTDSYYRQSASDVAGHHGREEEHGDAHHDTSTYYGPYPVICL